MNFNRRTRTRNRSESGAPTKVRGARKNRKIAQRGRALIGPCDGNRQGCICNSVQWENVTVALKYNY